MDVASGRWKFKQGNVTELFHDFYVSGNLQNSRTQMRCAGVAATCFGYFPLLLAQVGLAPDAVTPYAISVCLALARTLRSVSAIDFTAVSASPVRADPRFAVMNVNRCTAKRSGHSWPIWNSLIGEYACRLVTGVCMSKIVSSSRFHFRLRFMVRGDDNPSFE
ncbi:uncharacterized protein EI90DRAFT_1105655 [Cantharellus anzutake]|uniref:uncharacterized protein n=1 Tax=Cantharellus anzutake TaxID=1750568 RepID=UPI0019047625|nr:uncharacterized protein EI90DRAFT_1105655 [Cantharellus anzutake]KAF8330869.1 hypothetical protein EI90DRAFT_1105655 [Cantharellus anzutake]